MIEAINRATAAPTVAPPAPAAGVRAVAPVHKTWTPDFNTLTHDRITIERAMLLAQSTLDNNLANVRILDDPRLRTVIFAGKGKFEALWTRDAMYASMGALATGHAVAVKGTLETLLSTQYPDGLIARRVGDGSVEWNAILNGIGVSRKTPTHLDTIDRDSDGFWTGTKGVVSVDSNMLVVQLAAGYIKQTGDTAFLNAHYPQLEKAMGWLKAQVKDGLISQGPYSDWKDCTNRGQFSMYNQVLYLQSLKGMADLATRRGDKAGAGAYQAQADALAGRIQSTFWDDKAGIYRDSELFAGFSPDGNLMAIAYGLATPAQTSRIFAHVDQVLKQRPLLPAAEVDYPADHVIWPMRLIGMQHYQDSQAWPWQESLYAIAAVRAGDKPRAEQALTAVANLAVRDRGFYEVYEGKDPKPVKKAFYASEPSFSWSSGLFLKAYQELYGG